MFTDRSQMCGAVSVFTSRQSEAESLLTDVETDAASSSSSSLSPLFSLGLHHHDDRPVVSQQRAVLMLYIREALHHLCVCLCPIWGSNIMNCAMIKIIAH